jgi:acyl-coenzyme A thioesterase PaaI-like protein
VFVLTVSYNVYFTRPVSRGALSAKGKIVQFSKRLLIAESVILDSDGNEVGRGSGTFMCSNIPLTEGIGYK